VLVMAVRLCQTYSNRRTAPQTLQTFRILRSLRSLRSLPAPSVARPDRAALPDRHPAPIANPPPPRATLSRDHRFPGQALGSRLTLGPSPSHSHGINSSLNPRGLNPRGPSPKDFRLWDFSL
jgi:hypothetical protein